MEWSRNDLHEQKETGVRSNASEHVTLVEVLELTSTFEEFTAAIQATARSRRNTGAGDLAILRYSRLYRGGRTSNFR
jgi:hypothetical protein